MRVDSLRNEANHKRFNVDPRTSDFHVYLMEHDDFLTVVNAQIPAISLDRNISRTAIGRHTYIHNYINRYEIEYLLFEITHVIFRGEQISDYHLSTHMHKDERQPSLLFLKVTFLRHIAYPFLKTDFLRIDINSTS